MKRILVTFLAMLPLFCLQAKSDVFSPVIEHLDIRSGLLNGFVTDITQDSHGFLWIATDAGLNRFDGENFKAYTEKNTPLCGNAINTLLYEPESDLLWIGTKKGVNVLNCLTQKFENIELPENYHSLNVSAINSAKDGGVWILGHYNAILHYKNGQFIVYTSKELPDLPMSFECITEGNDGNLYIGHSGYGFSAVNLKTKKVENYRSSHKDTKSLPGDNVRAIFIDRYKNIWVGTNNGVALYNPVSKDFSRFTDDTVYTIKELNDGRIWLGSDVGGVSLLDIQNLTFSNPNKLHFMKLLVSPGKSGLSSENIRSIFQDSFGNIWIGNYGEGLDYISSVQPPFKVLPFIDKNAGLKESVSSVFSDKDGTLWVGGKNYVVHIGIDGQPTRRYHLGGSMGDVLALTRVGEEIFASIHGNGIKKINIQTGRIANALTDGSTKYIDCFYHASDGRLLAGTIDGLYEYRNGSMKRLDDLCTQFNSLTVYGLAIDKQQNLWVGTYGAGVFIFDKSGKLIARLFSEQGFVSNAIKSIYHDSRGWMWIAGQDGLSVVKDTSKPTKFENFGYDSGLDDIHIRSIVEDKNGDMWFSTNNSLIKWKHKNGNIENYDYRNGLPLSNFLDRAVACDGNGNIYFGSLKGICSFNPADLQNRDKTIPVSIVECQNVISPTQIGSVAGSGSKVEVPYDHNSLRIIFSVPDISKSRLVEYSYMIEGIDNEWVMAGKEHSATLWNLPPGTYTFKVRARLRNQEWNDANIATLKITVTPPIWLTWYAKLFYIFLIAALIYGAIRFYNHRLLLKNLLELERRKSIDEQALNNERLRFYTNITHELRTPLTLILGPLEDLVSDTAFPKNYQNKIKTIHTSALRLLNLINQILEFRKTETQNRKLQVSRGNLSKIVMEIGLRYKELNRNNKVTLNLNIADDITDVYFDRDVIHTILNNLLSNAMKYTPEGNITLSLRRDKTSKGDFVEISVADTGYGIEEKSLPHIFDRYYQAEGKHQASGTGIGLALVKSLSDLHEGTLGVNSIIGKGTVFTFRFDAENTYPDALHKEETETKTEEPTTAETTENQNDNRPVLLVVEDNDDIRDYIDNSLNSTYQILTAANGKEGYDLAVSKIPDIIVSDVMMPVMDGMEMLKLVKSDIRTSHIPIVLLTAKDTLQDKEEGYEFGADSYLTKPFSAKLLASRIKNILESRRLLASIISANLRNMAVQQPVTEATAKEDGAEKPEPLKLSKLDEEFMKKFTDIVEANIVSDKLDMPYMQEAMGMSHSTLYRKIKSLTGMSGNEFIRKIRLKHGYKALEEGCNVSEAAYSCGFNDVGYFRNCFREEFGVNPSQFIKERTT